ncbi:hypothetical protein HA402_001776 [Bradysia odoriphaga]|nr:hypothetical protein HA402_001776 [Bradysia odoriphaga]
MSSRNLADVDMRKQIKTEFSSFNEHCDFCVLSFQTRQELKAHVLTHFKRKICLETQKTLLLIVDDWFELHVNHDCGVDDQQPQPESVRCSVHITESLIKTENCVENDLGVDAVEDETSTKQTKIESESETEINFDGNLTESSSASSDKVIKNVRTNRSKSKKSKQKNIEEKQVPTTIRKKTKAFNQRLATTKPAQSKAKRVKCKICKQKITQEELIPHLQSRHVPKIDPIPTCETCGKTFSTPGNLRSHQYLHAERGRYICSYCGKEFFRNANLKEHINLHTGARPFQCKVCKKTFHRETLLRNHTRIHTGEKKYRCNYENCERAYMFDIDLKRHKFSAHGIYSKKHPCFICSKIFSENKLLKKHMETH